MTLGEFVTKYRNDHGLSMRSFAGIANLSVQYISNLEKGTNNRGDPLSPTIGTYSKIAKACGLSDEDLLLLLIGNSQTDKPLSADESLLIDLYRQADPLSRAHAVDVLRLSPCRFCSNSNG